MYPHKLQDPDFAELIASQAAERGAICEHYYWISVATAIRESLKREAERTADVAARRRNLDSLFPFRETTISGEPPCSR